MSFLSSNWPSRGSDDYITQTKSVIDEINAGLAAHEAIVANIPTDITEFGALVGGLEESVARADTRGPHDCREWGIDADDNDHASDFATMVSELASETNRAVQLRPGDTAVDSSVAIDVRGICLVGTGGGRPADQGGSRILFSGSGALFELGEDSGNPHNQNEYDGIQNFALRHINIVADTTGGTTALANGKGNYRTGSLAIRDWRGGDIRLTDVQVENFEYGFWGIQSDLDIFRDVTWIRNHVAAYVGPRSDQFIVGGWYSFFNDQALWLDDIKGGRIRDFTTVADGSSSSAPVKIGSQLATRDTGCNGIVFDAPWFESHNQAAALDAMVEIGVGDAVTSWNIVFREPIHLGTAHGTTEHTHSFLKVGNGQNIVIQNPAGYFQDMDRMVEFVGDAAFATVSIEGYGSYGQNFTSLDSKSNPGAYNVYRDQRVGAGRLITGGRTVGLQVEADGDVKLTEDIEIDGILNHDGTTVGFYDAAPVAKQTGVAVNAAAIHAALVNLGLIGA